MTSTTDTTALSPESRARYARQIRLDGFGPDAQAALSAAHVVVIGAGGLGAPLLTYLAAAGVGTISVIDPDVVELSNLHRQFIHGESTVGERKVDSAAARLSDLNSSIEIITHALLLTPDNALELLAGADVVVDGSDNFSTRYLVNDACEILGLPLVWGTILGFSGQLAVFDATRGATLRDLFPVVPAPGSVPDCATAGVIGALCGSIGSAMAMETIKVIAGIGTPLYDSVAIHDSLDLEWETIPVSRIPDRPRITSMADHACDYGQEVVVACSAASGPADAGASPTTVTWDRLGEGVHLVDIREDAEVAAGMVPGASHVPMDRLLEDPSLIAGHTSVALYCRSGVRSGKASAALRERGIEAASVSGGYLAYLSLT